jgi:hypothetical protein
LCTMHGAKRVGITIMPLGYAVGTPHLRWKTLRDVLKFIWKELNKE